MYVTREQLHKFFDDELDTHGFKDRIPARFFKLGVEFIAQEGRVETTVFYRQTTKTREIATTEEKRMT